MSMQFNLNVLAKIIVNPKLALKFSLMDWYKFILILREAKLLASFYHISSLDGCLENFPAYAFQHLKSASVRADRQRQQVIYECDVLDKVLAEINVKPVYMKGANYVLRNSLNSLGRIVSDIDVLVQKYEIEKVEKHLKSKLWRSDKVSDYDDKYYRQWAHEIPPMYHLLRGTVLDIHHNIYLPISGRSPSITYFTRDLVTTSNGCHVLSNVSSVLHSIIHLFMNEDFTNAFRDMIDIHMLLNQFEDEQFWTEIHALAIESKFEKELYWCLTLREKLFNATQPTIYSVMYNKYNNVFSDFFVRKVLFYALTPKHRLLINIKVNLAVICVFMRGHWIKMPPLILIKHLSLKLYLGLVEKLFGKHFLDKE